MRERIRQRLESLRPRVPSLVVRLLVLLVAMTVVVKWQRGFIPDTSVIESGHVVTASTGLNRDKKFFFYLWHLNLYPIATDAPIHYDSKSEAQRLMRESPQELRQDEGTTFRSGDRGRTYLFFIDAWLNKRSLAVSIKPAHELAFVSGLLALVLSFWFIRRTLAGLGLALLLGSNPFQLHAVFKQENVFSWAITAMIWLLAIHVPLLERRDPRRPPTRFDVYYPWVAAALGGFFLAFVRNFRSEPTVLVIAAPAVYLTMGWLKKRTRVSLVLVSFLALMVGTRASTAYFDGKLKSATAAVAAVGGPAYAGPVEHFHEFWHALACGLGDFDTKHGYRWDDRNTYKLADPELKKLNPNITLDPNKWKQDRAWDKAGRYEVYYFETPGYHRVIRDKVVGDIKSDPWWYVDILKSRLWRTLTEVTPVGLALSDRSFYLTGPLLSLACIPLAAFLAYARRWAYLKMLLFSVPLSGVPMVLYSGGGMTNYSMYHYFGLWIMLCLAWEGGRSALLNKRAWRFSKPRPD
jgi:hypothetical protein